MVLYKAALDVSLAGLADSLLPFVLRVMIGHLFEEVAPFDMLRGRYPVSEFNGKVMTLGIFVNHTGLLCLSRKIRLADFVCRGAEGAWIVGRAWWWPGACKRQGRA